MNKIILSEKLSILNDPNKGRRQIINDLGINAILDRIKERYQNWIDLSDEDISYAIKGSTVEHVRDSYRKVLDNFDVLLMKPLLS